MFERESLSDESRKECSKQTPPDDNHSGRYEALHCGLELSCRCGERGRVLFDRSAWFATECSGSLGATNWQPNKRRTFHVKFSTTPLNAGSKKKKRTCAGEAMVREPRKDGAHPAHYIQILGVSDKPRRAVEEST